MKLIKNILILFSSCLIAVQGKTQEKPGSLFTESDIMLRTNTGDISGTLTVPVKPGKTPLVIIIAGSGPTDRDGNSPLGVRSDMYKMLAGGFAENGISTL